MNISPKPQSSPSSSKNGWTHYRPQVQGISPGRYEPNASGGRSHSPSAAPQVPHLPPRERGQITDPTYPSQEHKP
ncbi:hypothetical protein Pmani_032214 [Petrolisthes manimaculis]|uniref:Uncharacterized protein n=1 Tax=Petrolisthes manimaculis TaxID=1843537 RepID=A0AAE1NU31_9EUCA|nr:hypothetical protein Pmani_032214 [Petrolisthes manimaculis]